MAFSIITDTSANLPSKQLKENNVTVVPFSYYVGEKEYTCLDTDSFNGAEYYDLISNGAKVTTSQINPQRYIDHIEPLLKEEKDVLYVGMSSGISGSYASAEAAAAQLREKYPKRKINLVDTLGASLGEGLLVIKAIEYLKQDFDVNKATDLLLSLRHRMCQVFTVDDLMYLRRTGRVSNVTAVVGTVLNIKPLLKGSEIGKIVPFGKARGRKRAIEALAERYRQFAVHPEKQTVGIAQANCEEDADYLKKLIKRIKAPKDFLTVCYEPVTGAHAGPGTLALFFESVEGIRAK